MYLPENALNTFDIPSEPDDRVRLELSADTLSALLNAGLLCAADFRCLDHSSKRRVWKLCLSNCTHAPLSKTAAK